MHRNLLLGGLCGLAALASGCSQDSGTPFQPELDGTATPTSVVVSYLNAAGGALATELGSLELPAGTLQSPTEMTFETDTIDGFTNCEVGPDGCSFGSPALLSLLAPSASQVGNGPYVVERWNEPEGRWEPVGGEPAGTWIEVGIVESGSFRIAGAELVGG